MQASSRGEIIYVALLNEGIPVWRPVVAVCLEGQVYRILGAVPPDESWQFVPGQLVICAHKVFPGGETRLVAVREASPRE